MIVQTKLVCILQLFRNGTKRSPIFSTIQKSKIRGEVSMGMICAEDEIGLGSGHNGIMVLKQEDRKSVV